MQSLEEAIYNYVPIVGMPFVSDQKYNVRKIVSKGLGLAVDHTKIDEPTLKNTILEVITNPR